MTSNNPVSMGRGKYVTPAAADQVGNPVSLTDVEANTAEQGKSLGVQRPRGSSLSSGPTARETCGHPDPLPRRVPTVVLN